MIAFSMAAAASPAAASDVNVRVQASTFNQFVSALQPISFSGRYRLRITVDLGLFGRHRITLCDSAYSGVVSGLAIDINASRIRAVGDVAFSWCNLSFGGPGPELVANGDLTYEAADDTLRLRFPSAVVRPTFNLLGHVVVLPVAIDIGSMINVPPLPVGTALVSIHTPLGARSLRVSTQDVRVTKGAGFVTVAADVAIR